MAADKQPVLDLESRRTIYRHIEVNPGLHLRGLQRALDMPLGTLEYHLHQMERSGLIHAREDGRFKAFFVTEGLDRRDKDILYYVRQEMPRRIVMHLLLNPGTTHRDLTAALPISASTCSFHVKKLIQADVIAEERAGRSKHYTVNDADRVANVLVRYRRSFLDDLVDRFARAWLDLGRDAALADGRPRGGGPGYIGGDGPATEDPGADDEDDAEDPPARTLALLHPGDVVMALRAAASVAWNGFRLRLAGA